MPPSLKQYPQQYRKTFQKHQHKLSSRACPLRPESSTQIQGAHQEESTVSNKHQMEPSKCLTLRQPWTLQTACALTLVLVPSGDLLSHPPPTILPLCYFSIILGFASSLVGLSFEPQLPFHTETLWPLSH